MNDMFDLFDAMMPVDAGQHLTAESPGPTPLDGDPTVDVAHADGEEALAHRCDSGFGEATSGELPDDVMDAIDPRGVGSGGADATFPEEDVTAPMMEPAGEVSSLWDVVENFVKDIGNFVLAPFSSDEHLVRPDDISADGQFDHKNNLIVAGDVANDIQYVEEQTAGSCSLMAQEQFVHRYIGRAIPEEYLEWQAEQWGVYSPEAGTNYAGQCMVLDHFDIPYSRDNSADANDLERALDNNKDVIVGVDARVFYDDASLPPGSGHAVAIVGKGIDPATHETAGYYVTDSNYPGTVRLVAVDTFDAAWQKDMIAVPNPQRGVA